MDKIVSGAGLCTNEFFGKDPSVGNGKTCSVADSSSPPVVGSARLSWSAPTTNVDGTPLTDLAGYRIYYGRSSGSYSSSITISNPAATTYTIQGLTAGTYYAVVRAFDSSNNEGPSTVELSKTIQ